VDRWFFVIGSVLGGLGVAAGAFAAHGLEGKLDPKLLAAFATGARYHLVHAVALLVVAWACQRWSHPGIAVAGWLMIAGVVLFSGSLYAMALSGVRGLGAITPIGGVAFLAGWGLLAWAVLRSPR
jgi:uncharacterized membrane protein YgdD (TMEM256/DUF423 family)